MHYLDQLFYQLLLIELNSTRGVKLIMRKAYIKDRLIWTSDKWLDQIPSKNKTLGFEVILSLKISLSTRL